MSVIGEKHRRMKHMITGVLEIVKKVTIENQHTRRDQAEFW